MRTKKKEKTVLIFLFLFCAAILAGCGGGGGGGGVAPTPTGITISGTVSAPTGVSLGRVADRSGAATGLNGKSGVIVMMYRIDDAGLKTGNILVTTTTDERGEYSLVIPIDINAASNLVVAVGSGNNMMRAIVVSREPNVKININPMTELVVSEIIDRGQPLVNYSTDEIAAIQSQVESDAAAIDLSQESSISSAKTKLKSNSALASNLDAAIKTASGVFCGNNVLESGEQCDDGNTAVEVCAYGQTSCAVCNAACQSVAGAVAYCGDGTKNGTEGCDDGNVANSDGCSSTCFVEVAQAVCGNGIREGAEGCDDSNTITESCAYGQTSCVVCNATCASVAGAVSYCGDGTMSGSEQCDGLNLNSATCVSQGFDGGTLSCSSCSFNTSGCTTNPIPQHYVSQWGSNGSGIGQYDNPRGMAVDGSGNVYVVDQNNNRVDVTDANGTHIAYIGPAIAGTTNLSVPEAVCVSKVDGTIGITEQNNPRVVLLSSAQVYLREFGSYGQGDSQFSVIRGCVFDSNNNIYVVDDTASPANTINHRVQKFDINGVFLTKWGQRGATDGNFYNPTGIAIDSQNNVYVSEATNNRIQKFTSAGVWIAKWGTTGTADGQFSFPYHLGIDDNDYIYVMDFGNDRAQVFSSDGIWLYTIGSSGMGNGQFADAVGIAVTSAGVMYVSDWTKDNVQKFTH